VIPCIVVDIDQHFCRTYLSYGVFYRKYWITMFLWNVPTLRGDMA
jgi:hypothetical protein